jgi:GTP-binding protein HflX
MPPARLPAVPELPRGGVLALTLPRRTDQDAPALLPPLQPTLRRTEAQTLAEAANLLQALAVEVCYQEAITLNRISPATLLGGGVVARLAEAVASQQLEVFMIDTTLSPRQQRELEVALQCKVLDRTGVILEIFAARARTAAGKLQVELAQLSYQQSRLVRLWSHLERQRGGMGKTGGPGERQLEIDKRLIKTRLAKLRAELREVQQTRGLQRMARVRAQTPTVALVGYTNAGKSTLFNALVGAGTLMADALFATLDPLMRRLKLPTGLEIVLIDTVGFIANLPHELVEAFQATLEEVTTADLLLHVHDASNPEYPAQAADVHSVLAQIGAADKKTLQVFNKLDCAEQAGETFLLPPKAVGVSAVTGQGVAELLGQIGALLQEGWHTLNLQVAAADGRRLAWLHAHGEVIAQVLQEDVWALTVKLRASDAAAWEKL